jgi:hypothetical protein
VAGSCEYSDEPSGSGATELVIYSRDLNHTVRIRTAEACIGT